MNIVGVMLVRNESWILRASIDAALRWVDKLAVLNHKSTDESRIIAAGYANQTRRVVIGDWTDEEHWLEMDARQSTLEIARELGATHVAIIDADEILTHDCLPHVRLWFEALEPGECLDLAMIAPWKSLDQYTRAIGSPLTLGFRDKDGIAWRPRGDEEYHYHNRSPQGSGRHVARDGRVMHLQFANWRRFIAKHRHYMASERIRWGYPVKDVNEKYSWWARLPHETRAILPAWWGDYRKADIKLDGESWYESALAEMQAKYADKLEGLDFTFGGAA